MPSSTSRQRRFFGVQLGKLRTGKKLDVKMSESQLRDFARKPLSKGRSLKGKR